jgi:hypothetical protein
MHVEKCAIVLTGQFTLAILRAQRNLVLSNRMAGGAGRQLRCKPIRAQGSRIRSQSAALDACQTRRRGLNQEE